MIPPSFVELESDSNGVGGEVECRNVIIGSELAQLFFDSLLIAIVQDHWFEGDLLFYEVHLKVVDFIGSFQYPFNGIQMYSQFLLNVIEVCLLKLQIWPSEAFKTAIGLKKIRLKLLPKIYHIWAERVKLVLFVWGNFGKNVFGFWPNLTENQSFFINKTFRKELENFCNQR